MLWKNNMRSRKFFFRIYLINMYAELRITNFIFVFIIPFSNKDAISFGEDKNFEYFWQFNKHYARVKDWVFNRFNLDLAKETVFNMQMSKRTTVEINGC